LATKAAKAGTPRRGRPRDPERLRRIVEAANREFFARGYDNANLDTIAQTAGVSKMTVYSYFPSKNALFEGVIGTRTDQVLGDLRGSMELDPQRPRETLEHIGAQFQALMRDEATLARFRTYFSATATQPEACRAFYKQGPERLINDLADYLRKAHSARTLRIPQPRLSADLFLSMFLGGAHLHAMFGLGAPAASAEKELLREAVRVFMAAYAGGRGVGT
jgi:AcrR family transcriptional regulator